MSERWVESQPISTTLGTIGEVVDALALLASFALAVNDLKQQGSLLGVDCDGLRRAYDELAESVKSEAMKRLGATETY